MTRQNEIEYTQRMVADDVTDLWPYAGAGLRAHEVLCRCVVCGKDAQDIAYAEYGEDGVQEADVALFAATCGHHDEVTIIQSSIDQLEEPKIDEGRLVRMPDTKEDRLRLVEYIRTAVIRTAAKEGALPIVFRPLGLDAVKHGVRKKENRGLVVSLDTDIGAYTLTWVPVPWRGHDGAVHGGKIARESVIIRDAIDSGKASVRFVGGSPIVKADRSVFDAMQVESETKGKRGGRHLH
jgi:hypothetical protein